MSDTKTAAQGATDVLTRVFQEPMQDQPKTAFDTYCCPRCEAIETRPVKAAWMASSYSKLCAGCSSKDGLERFNRVCPPLYQKTDPARLPKSSLMQVMGWAYGPTGLLCTGPTGTGKTRSVWLMLRQLAENKYIVPEFFDAVRFAHEVSKRFSQGDGDGEAWITKISKQPLIFFDDLGKNRMTDRVEAELFGLIERRCAAELPIIATTNDTGSSLVERMSDGRGPALVRRLREFCQVVNFTGEQKA